MLSSLRTWWHLQVQAFVRSMPFRRHVGKLGMWMVRMGGVLQTRYAGYNQHFRLQAEVQPGAIKFHVSEPMTQAMLLTFSHQDAQVEKQSPMVRELLRVNGVRGVHLYQYEVHIYLARVFSPEEIRPQLEEIIIRHLTEPVS